VAIIVVGGSGRGAGKTALVCGLITALKELRWTAVKITSQAPGDRAPIWEETRAGDDTETGRYLTAGAARAFLVTPAGHAANAEPELAPLLDELWPHFGRGTNLIFESNRVVHHVRPDVCLMIHARSQRDLPLPERTPSFIAAISHADAMVTWADEDRFIPGALGLPGQEPKPVFHLAALGRVSQQMQEWIRDRLDPPCHS